MEEILGYGRKVMSPLMGTYFLLAKNLLSLMYQLWVLAQPLISSQNRNKVSNYKPEHMKSVCIKESVASMNRISLILTGVVYGSIHAHAR